MAIGHTRSATPLARPVDLSGTWNATDDDVAAPLPPAAIAAALGTAARRPLGLPGPARSRWAPALPGGAGSSSGDQLTVDLRGHGRASHLVVAHFCRQLARPGRPTAARHARRLGPAGRRAARPLRARLRGWDDPGGRRPPPIRDRRRDHRLGLPAVRARSVIATRSPSTGAARMRASTPGRYAPAGHGGALDDHARARGARPRPGSWTTCRRSTTTRRTGSTRSRLGGDAEPVSSGSSRSATAARAPTSWSRPDAVPTAPPIRSS